MSVAVESRAWSYAFVLIWLTGLGVALATFLDYGVTWDEDIFRLYGDAILRWFATLGRDREALSLFNLYVYGGLFEVFAQPVGRAFPAGVFEGRHLVNALVGLIGVAGTYQLGVVTSGPRVGCLAGAALLVNPVYYGHSFNNPKDIPFAAMCAWALAAIVAGSDGRFLRSWRAVFATGLAVGLALAVRPGGVFLIGFVALLWTITVIRLGVERPRGAAALQRDIVRLATSIAAVAITAWIVMIAPWPYGQSKPLVHPIEAITRAARFREFEVPVLFGGRSVQSGDLPWTYIPGYFAVSLPDFYLLGFAAGILALPWVIRRVRDRQEAWSGTAVKIAFLLFAVIFPVAVAVAMESTLYDGLRHVLFLMPPLAVLAALGFVAAIDALPRRAWKAAVAGAALGFALWVVVDMIRLHPYQSVYYNRLIAGGVRGAEGRFEADYWGSSYLEATNWVLANYRPETSEPIRVANCSDNFMTAYYLRRQSDNGPRFESGDARSAHVVLATTRGDCHRRNWGRLLHVVERQGVGLAYVFEVATPR